MVSTPQLLLAEYKFSDTRTTPTARLKAKASFGVKPRPCYLLRSSPLRTTHGPGEDKRSLDDHDATLGALGRRSNVSHFASHH